MRVDPIPGELLFTLAGRGGLFFLLLPLFLEVEMLLVLDPGYHRQQTGFLAVKLASYKGLEITVYTGPTGQYSPTLCLNQPPSYFAQN